MLDDSNAYVKSYIPKTTVRSSAKPPSVSHNSTPPTSESSHHFHMDSTTIVEATFLPWVLKKEDLGRVPALWNRYPHAMFVCAQKAALQWYQDRFHAEFPGASETQKTTTVLWLSQYGRSITQLINAFRRQIPYSLDTYWTYFKIHERVRFGIDNPRDTVYMQVVLDFFLLDMVFDVVYGHSIIDNAGYMIPVVYAT
jgi:hypothetical protein